MAILKKCKKWIPPTTKLSSESKDNVSPMDLIDLTVASPFETNIGFVPLRLGEKENTGEFAKKAYFSKE